VDRRVVAHAEAATTVFLDHETPAPRMGFGAMQRPGGGRQLFRDPISAVRGSAVLPSRVSGRVRRRGWSHE